MATCPACDNNNLTVTGDGKPDEFNQIEYRCNDCGEYFTDDAPPPPEKLSKPKKKAKRTKAREE